MEKKNIENKRLTRMAREIRVGLTCEDIKIIIHDYLEYFYNINCIVHSWRYDAYKKMET